MVKVTDLSSTVLLSELDLSLHVEKSQLIEMAQDFSPVKTDAQALDDLES